MAGPLNGEPAVVCLAGADGDRLEIRVRGRLFPDSDDPWDGNALSATLTVRAGGFQGQAEARLRPEDFAIFRDEVTQLHLSLAAKAQLKPFEPWIQLDLLRDSEGRVEASAWMVDRLDRGNALAFGLRLDTSDLPAIVRALDAIVERYPVRGD